MMIFVVLPAMGLWAQAAVSQAVQTTFNSMFSDVEDINWEVSADKSVATFYLGDYYKEATFQPDGKWMRTVTNLEVEELPVEAQTLIQDQFQDVNFYTDIVQVETPKNVVYLVNFETETQTVHLTFKKSGELLDKKVLPIKDDGE